MTTTQKITFFASCLPMLFLSFNFSCNTALAQGGGADLLPETTGGGRDNGQIEPVSLENPLRVNSLEELLVAILNIFMVLMIPIVVFFIIWAGFKYVTAQGNPGQIEEATTTFTYAVIGGVLILAAVAIAEIIRNTVDSFAA
jgi:hypothetical protein